LAAGACGSAAADSVGAAAPQAASTKLSTTSKANRAKSERFILKLASLRAEKNVCKPHYLDNKDYGEKSNKKGEAKYKKFIKKFYKIKKHLF
jgi:hypothetical protein